MTSSCNCNCYSGLFTGENCTGTYLITSTYVCVASLMICQYIKTHGPQCVAQLDRVESVHYKLNDGTTTFTETNLVQILLFIAMKL